MTPPLALLETAPLKDLRPIRFSSVATAPLVGAFYELDQAARVDFRPVGLVRSEAVYVFSALSVKVGAPEHEFLCGINPSRWPGGKVWSDASGIATTPVFPFPIVGYTDAAPTRFAWEPSGDPDKLSLSLEGQVQQTPWMATQGITDLVFTVVIDGYEISNALWKKLYLEGWNNSWVADALGLGSGSSGRAVRLQDGSNVLRERTY